MRKRRWLLIGAGLILTAAVLAAEHTALWYGSRAPDEEAERLATLAGVGPGDVLAEIGAGRGEMARALAPTVLPGGHLIVTELSDARLADLRAMVEGARWTHVEVRRGEVDGTALAADCCDLIYMRHVFHHFGDGGAMGKALADAVAPGGRLAVIDFAPQWLLGLISPVVRHARTDGSGHGITAENVIRELSAAGFVLEKHEPRWTAGSFLAMFRAP